MPAVDFEWTPNTVIIQVACKGLHTLVSETCVRVLTLQRRSEASGGIMFSNWLILKHKYNLS